MLVFFFLKIKQSSGFILKLLNNMEENKWSPLTRPCFSVCSVCSFVFLLLLTLSFPSSSLLCMWRLSIHVGEIRLWPAETDHCRSEPGERRGPAAEEPSPGQSGEPGTGSKGEQVLVFPFILLFLSFSVCSFHNSIYFILFQVPDPGVAK